MYSGFLPFSRATFMMDVVLVAMFLVLPILGISTIFVRKGSFDAHRKINTSVGIALLLVVGLFEIEVRVYGWRQFAEVSPFYGTPLNTVLGIHIFSSVSATFALIFTFWGVYKNFKRKGGQFDYDLSYRNKHAIMGKLSLLLLITTTITGSIFYYMAYVAGS